MTGRPQLKPDEFCVVVNCDGLHPDDIEELQRSLAESRYNFKVDVDQTVRNEGSSAILFIRIKTKLVVRFSANWFYGRTRRGGLQAVIKASADVLDTSSHDRDLKPKLSQGSGGEELITFEEWLRPRRTRRSWSRGEKLTAIGVILTVVAVIAAVLVVPEVRRFFHLDKPQPTGVETKPTSQGVTQSPAAPTESPKPSQRTEIHIKGNDNVAGNNTSGDRNVKGNNNSTSPTAIAPNGIAISGGNVQNPTVNNITALPDLTMSDAQEKQVSDSLAQTFAGVNVSITEVRPNQNVRDVAGKLVRILKGSGANVELNSASMYVPPAGESLHKGMSIVSFPPEHKGAVDKLTGALGTANVIEVLPIYQVKDPKINIVVNRSTDTPEEAKQY